MQKNVFVKPNEQSQTCLSFVMARKGGMKSTYVKPAMQATEIEGICIICTSVQNNAGLNPTIKGSSTISGTPTARSKGRGYWDEDEEDWEEDW